MRIAVSGTHFIGKSTFIEDFIKQHSHYKLELEPWYKLQEEQTMELALEPSLDSLMEQLDYSISQLNEFKNEKNIIFDRCVVDFLTYAVCALNQDSIDLSDSEFAEKLIDIKDSLNNLDIIVFLPITKENSIVYTEDNPAYRKAADKCFKQIYRDDIFDIFPRYNHPRIIELSGDRITRLKTLEHYL